MMLFEERKTKDGIEIKVFVEPLRITDMRDWPYFTAVFDGQPLKGKWLSPNAVQVGNTVFLRTPEGMSTEVVADYTILRDMYDRIQEGAYKSSPKYGYA